MQRQRGRNSMPPLAVQIGEEAEVSQRTDREKEYEVAAMHFAGKSGSDIHRETGLARTTVHNVIQRLDTLDPTTLERVKIAVADRHVTVAQKALRELDRRLDEPEELAKVTSKDLGIISGISTQRGAEIAGLTQAQSHGEASESVAKRLLSRSKGIVRLKRTVEEIEVDSSGAAGEEEATRSNDIPSRSDSTTPRGPCEDDHED